MPKVFFRKLLTLESKRTGKPVKVRQLTLAPGLEQKVNVPSLSNSFVRRTYLDSGTNILSGKLHIQQITSAGEVIVVPGSALFGPDRKDRIELLSEIQIGRRVDEATGNTKAVTLASVFVDRVAIQKSVRKFIEERLEEPQAEMWYSIEGEAGSGKTSILRKLAQDYAKVARFIYGEEENSLGKLEVIAKEVKGGAKRTVVFIDTLDYLITRGRAEELNRLIKELGRSGAIVVTTSRVQEMKRYAHVPSPALRISVSLDRFSSEEIREALEKYAKAYYPEQEESGVEAKVEEMMSNRSLLDLCANPLQLRMLFDAYTPDEINPKLYLDIQKLYDKYWGEKVETSRIYDKNDEVTRGKKKIVLELAFEMLKTGELTDNGEITDRSRSYGKAFEDLLSDEVIINRGKVYEFFHQTFFDYAAARAILSDDKNPKWSVKWRIEELLKAGQDSLRLSVLEQIALQATSFGRPQIKDLILEALAASGDFVLNLAAINIYFRLEHISNKNQEAIKNLQKSDPAIRIKMAEIAGKVTGKRVDRAIETLKILAKDEAAWVRNTAAAGLGEISKVKPEEALPALLVLAKDKDPFVRIGAAAGLGKIGKLRSALLALAKDKDSSVRAGAAAGLGEIGKLRPEEALPALLTLAKDYRVRDIAMAGLREIGKVKPEETLEILLSQAEDEEPWVRNAATVELGEIGKVKPEKVLPVLLKLTESRHVEVRASAASAIIGISETNLKETLPYLKILLAKLLAKKMSHFWGVSEKLSYMAEVVKLIGVKTAERIELGEWGIRIVESVENFLEKRSLRDFKPTSPSSEQEFAELVRELISRFKEAVENEQGSRLLWTDGNHKKESDIQVYFYTVANTRCEILDINLTWETKTGRGNLDFEFSRGRRFRVAVEFKKAENSELVQGIKTQLPLYMKAKDITSGLYVVIAFDEEEKKKAEKLRSLIPSIEQEHSIKLQLIVIDASRDKPSASKA